MQKQDDIEAFRLGFDQIYDRISYFIPLAPTPVQTVETTVFGNDDARRFAEHGAACALKRVLRLTRPRSRSDAAATMEAASALFNLDSDRIRQYAVEPSVSMAVDITLMAVPSDPRFDCARAYWLGEMFEAVSGRESSERIFPFLIKNSSVETYVETLLARLTENLETEETAAEKIRVGRILKTILRRERSVP